MIENFDVWRQENPQVTDAEAMEWLRRRFTQLNDQTRSEYTLAEHLKAVKDTLRGPGGKESADTTCKYYLQGQCKQGTQCPYKHDPSELRRLKKSKAPAAPATQASATPSRGKSKKDPKGKGQRKRD